MKSQDVSSLIKKNRILRRFAINEDRLKWLDRAIKHKSSVLALAWLINKIVEPIRLGLTLILTPFVARKLRWSPSRVAAVGRTIISSQSTKLDPSVGPSAMTKNQNELKAQQIADAAKKIAGEQNSQRSKKP